jgi:hypothetical protein
MVFLIDLTFYSIPYPRLSLNVLVAQQTKQVWAERVDSQIRIVLAVTNCGQLCDALLTDDRYATKLFTRLFAKAPCGLEVVIK